MRKLLLAFVLVAGCSNGNGNGNLIDPGPPPSNGLQIILPIVKGLQPGTDNELCTWTDQIADHDLMVRSVQGYQGPGGHHIIVEKTKQFEQPGTTRPCSTDDLTSIRFVAGTGGEGMQAQAPGDLVYMIEKGYQIVLNHHYINATPNPVDSQSAVNLYFADPGQTYVRTGALTVLDTSFNLATGPVTYDLGCTMQNDFKVWFGIPHMHAYGTRITVDHVTPAGPNRLFDVNPWDPTFTFHPPEMTTDPTQPMLVAKGDKLNVHCEWNNTTGAPITFGIEMCVFFAQTVDDTNQGNLECDHGQWGSF
jgi:hypothetical protein